jgi:hypothetical protein
MRKPSFTIRRLMASIALVAVSLHVGLSYRHSAEYLEMAEFYQKSGKIAEVRARNSESGAAIMNGYSQAEKRAVAPEARRFAAHAARMRIRYLWAAWLPWLPVAPGTSEVK